MLDDVLSWLDDKEDTPKEAEELTKDEVQKAAADAITEALAPIIGRIEKIENARGVSNRVPEESTVEKNSNDFWGGIF